MNISIEEVFDEPLSDVPAPAPLVHNHDFDPSCKEIDVDGELVGECMLQPEPGEEEPEDDDPELNINQLASHFGKKRYWVAEKLLGMTPCRVGKNGAKFYRLGRVEEILTAPMVQGAATEKADAQARKLSAEAGLKELELERKRGDTIEVADVEQGATELFRALHNRLVQYCDESGLPISKLTTRGDVVLYQKEHIGKILQDLRENPNNFVTRYLNENATS